MSFFLNNLNSDQLVRKEVSLQPAPAPVLTIPSFGSFDVSNEPTVLSEEAISKVLDDSSSLESGQDSDDKRKRRRKEKKKHRKRDKKHRKKEDLVPKPVTNEPKMYYRDRQGDELNLMYGNVHGTAIPAYKRFTGTCAKISHKRCYLWR